MNLTNERKTLIMAAVAAAAVGYFAANMNAQPLTPAQRRPVLAAIIRMAKNLLWLAAFAEPGPPDEYQSARHVHHVDDNGVVMVDHGQGW